MINVLSKVRVVEIETLSPSEVEDVQQEDTPWGVNRITVSCWNSGKP
jgi:hypothetical protein